MAAALPFAALALSAGGQIYQGVEANNAARAGAAVDTENARLSLLSGEQDAWQARLDERRKTGEMIAGMAGSGVDLGSGSSADMIRENAYQRELEILGIRRQAQAQSTNLLQSAADKKRAGKAALVGSLFSAVSTAIGGASSMANQSKLARQSAAESSFVLGGGGGYRVPRMTVKGGGYGG